MPQNGSSGAGAISVGAMVFAVGVVLALAWDVWAGLAVLLVGLVVCLWSARGTW
jgi:hypothetical protein